MDDLVSLPLLYSLTPESLEGKAPSSVGLVEGREGGAGPFSCSSLRPSIMALVEKTTHERTGERSRLSF